MDNYILTKYNKELEQLSVSLGWERTLFLDRDFVHLRSVSKKELLKEVRLARKKKLIIVYQPVSEEMLRFALEKTEVGIVVGSEKLNYKDSVHFVRGGLDQIVCKIAKEKGKKIGFAFGDILESRDRAKLLGRMMFNIKLCKKYGVEVVLSSFVKDGNEMRSVADVQSLFRVLGGVFRKKEL